MFSFLLIKYRTKCAAALTSILTAKMTTETKAEASNSICCWNWVIMRESGFVMVVERKETAEMVIIELTKK